MRTDIQRKILRILYAWGLERFDQFMSREELISRVGREDIERDVEELKKEGLVELVPEENWKAIRITPKGVQNLRLFDVI